MTKNETGWRTLSKRTVHPGRIVHLEIEEVEAPDGSAHSIEVVRHQGAAAVLPLTSDGEVLLVDQYRPAIARRILELPAGKLDPGEGPESCARRELEEETGWRCDELVPLGRIWTTPGFTDERIWLFLARGLSPGRQELQAGEDLELVRMPLQKAAEMAGRGDIEDAKTSCALLRAAARLGVATAP